MKTIKYLLVSWMMTMVLVGCDNVLNQEPKDAFTNDNFWSQPANVEAFANAFYSQFKGYGNNSSYGDFYFHFLNDDQLGSAFVNWDHIELTTKNNLWKNSYKEIRRANTMIEKIPAMEITDAQKNNWLGVAKMMRAYEYFILVKNFGDVQWVNKVVETSDDDILYGARTDRDIVMDSVLNDINFACENITTAKSICAWSSSLANAMKSDICLFEGTFCKYRVEADGQKAPNVTRAEKYLKECVNANDTLMKVGYELEDYAATYNSVDLTSSKQVIFAKHYEKNLFGHALIDWTVSSSIQSGINKNAFEAFKMLATGRKGAWDANDYPVEVKSGTRKDDAGNVCQFISIEKVLALRDKRLSALVDPYLAYLGQGYIRWDSDLDGTSDLDCDKKNAQDMFSSTGLTIMKYDSKEIPYDYRPFASKNYNDAPLYWYAVILLNQAEAKAELETITDADLNATVNKLRERAGLPALTTTNHYDESSLKEAIHNDRRCELMCDNNYRYWDLIRWHQLDRMVASDCYLGMNISADPKKAERVVKTDDNGFIKAAYDKTREWDTKYYLYPIPADELNLNKSLAPNNPGW